MRKLWTALACVAALSFAIPQAEAAFPVPIKSQDYSPLDQARHAPRYCHKSKRRGYHCHYRKRHYHYYRRYYRPYHCHDPFFLGGPFFWPHCHWY